LVCVELLHIYKQNKEKALRIYEEILRLPYTEDLYSFITSKLRLGSHLKEYTEELVTELSIVICLILHIIARITKAIITKYIVK